MSNKKTTIDNNFPLRLRTLIEEKLKISQKEFAEKIGITPGYVSMVIGGKRGPSAEMIAGIAVNYRSYLEWILTGESLKNREALQASRKLAILDEFEEWVGEEVSKNGDRAVWLEIQLLDSFQAFKKWKEQRDKSEVINKKVA